MYSRYKQHIINNLQLIIIKQFDEYTDLWWSVVQRILNMFEWFTF